MYSVLKFSCSNLENSLVVIQLHIETFLLGSLGVSLLNRQVILPKDVINQSIEQQRNGLQLQ